MWMQMSVEVILKVYTKPATKSDLVAAINKFWLEGLAKSKNSIFVGLPYNEKTDTLESLRNVLNIQEVLRNQKKFGCNGL